MKILRFASYFHRLMRRNKQSLVVQSAARLCFYFFAMEILISLCYTIAMQRKTVCGCRLSSEKIAPFFAKPLDTLPAAPIMLLATGYWLLATGYWLLATGSGRTLPCAALRRTRYQKRHNAVSHRCAKYIFPNQHNQFSHKTALAISRRSARAVGRGIFS